MSKQLTFDLPVRTALGRGDYFISAANQAAVAAISGWQDWTGGKLVLTGPKGSGKTHLAHVWAAEAGAKVLAASALKSDRIAELVAQNPRIAVEDVEFIAGHSALERALLHLHNLTLAEGGRLLLTSILPPGRWRLGLPDLQSRVSGTGLVQLGAPDDALLSAVLVKLFADRQLIVAPDVIGYLAPRMERSFEVAGRLVAALDAASLTEARAVTRKLAGRVLDDFATGET